MKRIISAKDIENIMAGLSNNLYHKPCPFCKAQSQDSEVMPFNGLYAVVCNKCGMIGPKGYTPEDAERLWNDRGKKV